METRDKLAAMPWLGHLQAGHLDSLAACSWGLSMPEGTALYRHDDSGREALAVLDGTIELVRDTPVGEVRLWKAGPGALLGEQIFFDHRPRSGTARSTSAVELLAIDTDRLVSVAEKDPPFEAALLWGFWKCLSAKLRQANERLHLFFDGDDGGGGEDPRPAEPGVPDPVLDLETRRRLFREQALSPLEINFLASLSSQQRFEPGQVVFHEGDPAELLYVVADGEVAICKEIPGAGQEALAFLGRGSYFGEMALIDGLPRSATAKAHSGGALLLAIAEEVIDGLLHVDHASSVRLLRILCSLVSERLHESDEKLVSFYLLSGSPALPERRSADA